MEKDGGGGEKLFGIGDGGWHKVRHEFFEVRFPAACSGLHGLMRG